MRLKGKKVLVYGLGTSGQEVCKLLHSEGACVSIYDDDKRFSNLFCFEKKPEEKHFDFVVVSPGIKVLGNHLIARFLEESKVVSELDFAYSFMRGKIIAITGTNGKTTVCSLLGKIFDEAKIHNFVCGNIGLPLSNIAKKTSKKTVSIVEVSNFQLELSSKFSPHVACVLNITEDHIDRHGNMQEYKRVKEKIFQNFTRKDIAIVNLDDKESLNLKIPKRKKYFSKNELEKGAYVKNGYIYCDKKKIMFKSEVPLLGEKNLENVLCCVQIARLFHIKPQVIRKAIASFKAPSHRLEYVGEIEGAKVYNDSKSTNVACSLMAIESLKAENLVLMVGGRNKDANFDNLFSKNLNIREVVAFGECQNEILTSAQKFGYNAVGFEKMAEAVHYVRNNIEKGQTILFSPACASFDEFASYSARGQRFKELILVQE